MVQKNVPNLEAQIGKEKQCTMDVNLWRRDGDGIIWNLHVYETTFEQHLNMMITTKQRSNVPLEVPDMTMVSIACTWHSVKSWLGQERKSQLMDDNPNVLDSIDL